MPTRIQRKRTKGWRMPEGAVYVGRPTKFGNPFDARKYGIGLSLTLFRETAEGGWNPGHVRNLPDEVAHEIYEAHCAWLCRIGPRVWETIHCELRGKDLACFCSLDEPCHADVLLEIANR